MALDDGQSFPITNPPKSVTDPAHKSLSGYIEYPKHVYNLAGEYKEVADSKDEAAKRKAGYTFAQPHDAAKAREQAADA